MAVRNEAVRLSLIDDFTTPMAKAAAVTALLNRELSDVDGSSVRARKGIDGLNSGNGLPALDRNARKADQSINQLTGRLRLAADLVATLGPGLVPIGASLVPGLAAMATQAGAAAGAVGVTVLAVTGLGDALDALNAYQLEPTAENFAAMRTEMEKVGPDAAELLRFIDSLEPQLRGLQQTARAGMFPGFEDGIDSLLGRLPEVRNIVAELATVTGGLAADAGESLAGPEWDKFFSWLESRGGPILDEFGRTIGNFVNGIANLLVAFDPAAQDFSSGLLEMSESFAQWSQGLDSNQSFQEFLTYVRESGPQALDLIGSLIELLAGIATAAAPIGSAVLPVLTQVADIFATIAGSDIGTPILAGVAALSAYNRVMAVTAATQARLNAQGGFLGTGGLIGGAAAGTRASAKAVQKDVQDIAAVWATAGSRTVREQERMNASTRALRGNLGALGSQAARIGAPIAGLAVAGSGAADSLGLTNTASMALLGTMGGPWGAAIGGAVGFTMDLTNANDDLWESIDRVRTSLANATPTDSSLSQVAADLDAAREMYAQYEDELSEGGAPSILKNLFTDPRRAGSIAKNDIEDLFGRSDLAEAKAAVAELEAEYEQLRGSMSFVNMSAGQQQAALLAAADAARAEADAINGELISAMRSLRQERLRNANAELNYKSAILDARDALKQNGKTVNDNTRAGQGNLQALYDLAAAWNDQSDKVKNATGSLRNARGNFVDLASSMGMSEDKAKRLAQRLFEIPSRRVKVEVGGISEAVNGVAGLSSQIRNLQDRTVWITTRYRRVGSVTDALPDRAGAPRSWQTSADGTTVPKTGRGYADRHLYLLADGEEVISNRFGQADRHRSLLKEINANRLADGGTTGAMDDDNDDDRKKREPYWKRNPNSAHLDLTGVRQRLRQFENSLDRSTNRLNRETAARDDLVSKMSEVGSNAVGAVRSDIFAVPSNPWQASNFNADSQLRQDLAEGRELMAIINSLRDKGVTGPLLAELLGKQDINLARMYNSLPADVLSTRVDLYTQREQVLGQLTSVAGDAAYGPELREQTAVMQAVQAEVRALRKDVKDQTKTLDRASDRNSQEVTKGVNGGASRGQRNRRRGPKHGAGIK